jgi:SAM-dependent methyltransferase
MREKFYKIVVSKHLNSSSSVLVVGAGPVDIKVFNDLGFKKVKFTNLITNKKFSKIKYGNMENLTYSDNSFDYAVVHASLHHTSKPYKGIYEMYRVSRKGILLIESQDNFTMRLLIKFNLTEDFENSSIKYSGLAINKGGVDGTNIPNYIYRFTERELKKFSKGLDFNKSHKIYFDHYLSLDNIESRFSKGFLGKTLKFIIVKLALIFFFIFKKQKNELSFFLKK